MPKLPHRQLLPMQTAEILIEMIHAGEIAERLPGERQLASQLEIGRDTLRSALEILESRQIISPREQGKRRQILSSAGQTKAASHRIAFLSPKRLAELSPWMLVEFDTLRETLQKRGYQLQLVTPSLFHLKQPNKKLQELIKDTDVDAWILYQCPAPIQMWFQESRIPTMINGSAHPGIELPSVDEDWGASAFHAGTLLKRNGHRRIGLLRPATKLFGLTATENGLRKAFPGDQESEAIITMIERGQTENVVQTLDRTLRLADPPTAIVVTRSRHLLNLLSWAAQRQLSIPRDLSVISLASEPWFQHLFPKPTHYQSNPIDFSRALTRQLIPLAKGKSPSSQKKLIIPDFTAGQTIHSLNR